MNMYLSMSYFLGRILPAKLNKKDKDLTNDSSLLSFNSKEISPWDNIIVVLGESLSPNHLSYFGYNRKTTPFLDSLKNAPNFHALKGLSSGVSSDISIAFFFNVTYGEAGVVKMAKGDHCLNKLAKETGFNTYFHSVQDIQSLRYTLPYICTAHLDEFKSFETISPHIKIS
jgi:glucan phosphoethanolaminetransferase (alkaline phosphatase superfamily)